MKTWVKVVDTDYGDNKIYQNVMCESCEEEWTEEYTLLGISEAF